MRDPESALPEERQPNELRQWDLATGKLRWSERVDGAGWVASTADGKYLGIVIGYEIQLRDAASGKVVRSWTTSKPLLPLAFAPDGKTLAAGIAEWGQFGGISEGTSGGVQIWNVEHVSLVHEISDDDPTTFITYSVDGKFLASSSNGGPVKLWESATGLLARIFPGRFRADFSPQGEAIACVSTNSRSKLVGRVDLFRLHDGSRISSFTSDAGATASWLLCVTFSNDGKLLAASDWNGTVTLWDVATGERIPLSTHHDGGAHSTVFSPDGRFLATGSEDQTLRLWKLPSEFIQSEE
jgi:WD40 repeat protein